MANVKKCDRCGKVYPWEYKSKYARVMVYDEEGHLHNTDLCPECDKAAVEWMKVNGITISPEDEASFTFDNRRDAENFMREMRAIAGAWGTASLLDAHEIIGYSGDRDNARRGWYKSALRDMRMMPCFNRYIVSLPHLVDIY